MSDIQSSRIQGQGIQTLTAGSLVTIEPKNRNQERKQFVVSNLEAAGSGNIIYICSTDGSEALPVFPFTTITLETDSPFRIRNAAGVTISYVVGEVFFRGATIRGLSSAATGPIAGGNGGSGGTGSASGGGGGGTRQTYIP